VGLYVTAGLCFFSVWLPRRQPASLAELTSYAPLPSFSVYPTVRPDADTLLALDAYIRDKKEPAVVLASSFTLNSDLLSLVYPSFNPLKPLTANENILHLPQVDARDGLPHGLAYARYVVAAEPVQLHLGESNQRVVAVPAGAMLHDTPFSAAFVREDAVFTLRDGVTAYVYRRVRPNTEAEMAWLWEQIGL
jgi:hypothetical protein